MPDSVTLPPGFVFALARAGNSGRVGLMAWRQPEQLLEPLAVLKSLADQVSLVQMAEPSSATPGQRPGLPQLRASVNAFSRLWFGVVPASTGAIQDGLETDSPALLADLDACMRLPKPRIGWDF